MNQFDLKTFLHTLLQSKKRILLNCIYALIAGLIIAFSIPKTYLANASLAPEMGNDEMLGGGAMSSLSSLAGINLNKQGDAIGPTLYPDVISSNAFLVDLLSVKVKTKEGEALTYAEYLKNKIHSPWWAWPKKQLTKLIGSILSKDSQKRKEGEAINPKQLTLEEEMMLENIRGQVFCVVDEENGIINLFAYSQDPSVSCLLVDSVSRHLQNFITHYRTNKARNDLAYYQKLEKEAYVKYNEAKEKYATYCDHHMNVTLQSILSERESLENELQIAFNAYSTMKQQVQMAQAKVQEKTPAFTAVQESSVPNKADSPKKIFILMGMIFVAFAGTICWIYVKLLFFTKEKPVEDHALTEALQN